MELRLLDGLGASMLFLPRGRHRPESEGLFAKLMERIFVVIAGVVVTMGAQCRIGCTVGCERVPIRSRCWVGIMTLPLWEF